MKCDILWTQKSLLLSKSKPHRLFIESLARETTSDISLGWALVIGSISFRTLQLEYLP